MKTEIAPLEQSHARERGLDRAAAGPTVRYFFGAGAGACSLLGGTMFFIRRYVTMLP